MNFDNARPGQHPNMSSLQPRGSATRPHGESGFVNYRRIEQDIRPSILQPLKNIKYNAQAVAIGCSITASYYLEEGFSWPRIIEQLHGISMNVCAFSASSVMMQTYAFIDLLTQTKHPLHVYALVPDLERFWGPSMSAPTESQSTTSYMWIPEVSSYIRPSEFNALFDAQKNKDKPGKRLIRAATHTDFKGHKFMFPVEVGIQQSLIALEMLVNTCSIIRCNKHIFSWDEDTQTEMTKLGIDGLVTDISTFRPVGPYKWDDSHSACKRHLPTTVAQRRVWTLAHDDWHPGLHEHIHFAESFMSRQITSDEVGSIRA